MAKKGRPRKNNEIRDSKAGNYSCKRVVRIEKSLINMDAKNSFNAKRSLSKKSLSKKSLSSICITNNHNVEYIDACLALGFITQVQHRCAMRLRWLYTMKFGLPMIKSRSFCAKINRKNILGVPTRNYDCVAEKSHYNTDNEYSELISVMKRVCATDIVLNICVYNEMPSFLMKYTSNMYDGICTRSMSLSQCMLYNDVDFDDGLSSRGNDVSHHANTLCPVNNHVLPPNNTELKLLQTGLNEIVNYYDSAEILLLKFFGRNF